MTIEGLSSTLADRGVVWQGSGFALIGAASLFLLSIYSEADHWSIGIYRLAVTQLSWAFVLAIALAIEGIRSMFNTTAEIRKRARDKFIAKEVKKAERRGAQQAEERFKTNLRKQGIEITPELERDVFGNGRDRKWWNRFPPFRSR